MKIKTSTLETERVSILFEVLHSYAPTYQANIVVNKFRSQMEDDRLSVEEIEKNIVTAIHNGLAYGNWIWSING